MPNNPITNNPGRDQVLDRLWYLANVAPEVTRGSMTGQIKALSMIVAIEGLIPDRRKPSAHTQPAAPPMQAKIYAPPALEAEAPLTPAKDASFPDPDPIHPKGLTWPPDPISLINDANVKPADPFRLAIPPQRGIFARSR